MYETRMQKTIVHGGHPMIQNPILKGFCPDPSIIRVDDDYYIATSTFEWWPGVRLFHSKDLQHWEQIASPLRRQSQADLTGDPTSGGIWAPCLSYDGQYYYLVYTDVKTKKGRFYNTHNYVIRTRDLAEEWSEPVYLNSIGFDPSLFHDTDGRKYLVNMVNGFRGVLVQEYDPETGMLLGERHKVYAGSGLGFTEGPHLYHIGDYYYLIVAEGGTSYNHCVTIARATSVFGPYETCPYGPLLNSDQTPGQLQKCGHGDIVQTQYDEWYLVHLCARPDEKKQCVLGRETAIQKLIWREDHWPRLKSGGTYADLQTEEPIGIAPCPMEQAPDRDDFDGAMLPDLYDSPRVPIEDFISLTSRIGYLRMYGQESMNSLHHVALLARRQTGKEAFAETQMDFSPDCLEQFAGISYLYDAMHFYLLGKTQDEEGHNVLVILKSDQGAITDLITPLPLPDGTLTLRIDVQRDGNVLFSYAVGDAELTHLPVQADTSIINDDYCKGFTGAQFGIYAHDMAGLGSYADFDYFTVNCEE